MERLSLSLRCRHTCSRAEITHVHLTNTAALAIYTTTSAVPQPWIDTYSLTRRPGQLTSLSKNSGSYAVFPPTPGPGCGPTTLYAGIKDWTVQIGTGVHYRHSSSVLIRELATGKTSLEIKQATSNPLTWSRDGRLIAAAEGPNNERIGIWDAKSGARVGRVLSHINTVTHAAFASSAAHNAHLIITLSRDGTLRITNALTSRTVSRLEVGSTNPRQLVVSADGNTIVSVWDTTLHIWHPHTNDLTSYALPSRRSVEGWPLCFSPDCRYLACRTEDGFDLMEVSSGSVLCSRTSESIITSGAFSLDASTLLLGTMDGMLELWDISTLKGA